MDRPVGELIDEILKHTYDPVRAHAYYEAHKHLKGRQPGKSKQPGDKGHVIPFPKKASPPPPQSIPPQLQERVNQLKVRLTTLEERLRELLKNKQASKSSDHKTAAEKSADARASKKYRDKHKTELAQKRKQDAAKTSTQKTPISSMTELEVRSAIEKTRLNLQAAVAKARAAANNRGTA